MRGFEVANLDDLLNEIGKDRTMGILADYSCTLNADIEDFLKNKP